MFEELLGKITNRIRSWQNRFLSYGGRQVLINHALNSIPIYLLFVMNPPKKVLEQIHKIFGAFFWSKAEERKENIK